MQEAGVKPAFYCAASIEACDLKELQYLSRCMRSEFLTGRCSVCFHRSLAYSETLADHSARHAFIHELKNFQLSFRQFFQYQLSLIRSQEQKRIRSFNGLSAGLFH